MGFYFSGNATLQQITSPIFPNISGREFGILEQCQNILLLITTIILLKESITRVPILEKLIFAIGFLVFTFMLLEELDYGIHFYEYFFGKTDIIYRNWHNQPWTDGDDDGNQNVKYFKQMSDFLTFVVFIVLPLVSDKKFVKPIRHLIPSKWFIVGFAITILASRTAHFLEHSGFAIINGENGSLSGNISEFREAGNYYFFVLYSIYLAKIKIIKPKT